MIDLIKKLLKNDKFMYLVAGGCTTAVNVGSYAILRWSTPIPWQACNIISISLAIIFAFFANKLFVFRSKSKSLSHSIKEFAMFVGARLSTMVIEVGGMWVLFEFMKINEIISKIAVQFVVLLINYFISKFIVFKKR